jgi:L,D-peptidoglycan transpeptidase YkuD (ErfK/YbiS/YcfS/YnhG family)
MLAAALVAGAITAVPPSHLRGVGDARELVVVTNHSWTSTHATLRTYVKRSDGWHAIFRPMYAHIGRRGFGMHKREGDGQTPVGSYGVGRFFGTGADPGVHGAYRRTTPHDFWVDQSSSPYYNRWETGDSADSGHAYIHGHYTHVEHLYLTGVYVYAFVVRYNTRHTPGRGSAIFVHHTNGKATSGCISVSYGHIRELLRWLDRSRGARIIMGPTSYVAR